MASTIQEFDCDFVDERGALYPLISVQCIVWDVTSQTQIATVTTTAAGKFPATAVSSAVGARVRVRIPHDGKGRAGYVERTTV